MTCKECVYCWKDEDEEYPTCKFEKTFDGDLAPCEIDD